MNKTSKMIWQVLDSRNPGGIESHVAELSRGLQKAGWSLRVIFLKDYGPHPLKDRLTGEGIDYMCLSPEGENLFSRIKKDKPALMHSHGYKAGLICRAVGLFMDIPVVSTYHAGERQSGRLALYTALDRWTARWAHPIAVSEKIAAQLPSKTRVMNNFIALPETEGVQQKNILRIGFVGRLSQEKGPDRFCQLAKRHPGLSFHLYGDGPMGADLRQTYGHQVQFHGQVCMDDHWAEIDLLCMPSRFEGLPMAALEAMARGIPVLATDVGGLPRLIEHGENGWVLPFGSGHGFHQILQDVSQITPSLRDQLSQKARARIKQAFSPEVLIPKVEDLYHHALRDMAS